MYTQNKSKLKSLCAEIIGVKAQHHTPALNFPVVRNVGLLHFRSLTVPLYVTLSSNRWPPSLHMFATTKGWWTTACSLTVVRRKIKSDSSAFCPTRKTMQTSATQPWVQGLSWPVRCVRRTTCPWRRGKPLPSTVWEWSKFTGKGKRYILCGQQLTRVSLDLKISEGLVRWPSQGTCC